MIVLDIVTPTRKLVEGVQATSVKLPTVKGQAEVLPGHTEMVTLLETGQLSFVNDGKERKFAVSYGFAEVRKDKVIVLAETAEEAREINVERAKTAQQKAQTALQGTLTDEQYRKNQLKLQRALIRQQVAH